MQSGVRIPRVLKMSLQRGRGVGIDHIGWGVPFVIPIKGILGGEPHIRACESLHPSPHAACQGQPTCPPADTCQHTPWGHCFYIPGYQGMVLKAVYILKHQIMTQMFATITGLTSTLTHTICVYLNISSFSHNPEGIQGVCPLSPHGVCP